MNDGLMSIISAAVIGGLIAIIIVSAFKFEDPRKKPATKTVGPHKLSIEKIGERLQPGIHYLTVDDSVKVIASQTANGTALIQVK